jgi:hypothetical protein
MAVQRKTWRGNKKLINWMASLAWYRNAAAWHGHSFHYHPKNSNILQNYPVAKPANVFRQTEHDHEKMIS